MRLAISDAGNAAAARDADIVVPGQIDDLAFTPLIPRHSPYSGGRMIAEGVDSIKANPA